MHQIHSSRHEGVQGSCSVAPLVLNLVTRWMQKAPTALPSEKELLEITEQEVGWAATLVCDILEKKEICCPSWNETRYKYMNNGASFKIAQGRNVKQKNVAETKTVTLCHITTLCVY